MTRTNKSCRKAARRDELIYRTAYALLCLGGCWFMWRALTAYWAVLALVPVQIRAAACVAVNAAVVARWARKAAR